MANVFNVADFILLKAKDSCCTPKKLQKLLYYTQAWSLVLRDEKKLFDNDIEAWLHGPVIRDIYTKYRDYSYHCISKEKTILTDLDLQEDEIKLIENVWNAYGKYDADFLEMRTHIEDPWIEARKGVSEESSSKNIISIETMKCYYTKVHNEAN